MIMHITGDQFRKKKRNISQTFIEIEPPSPWMANIPQVKFSVAIIDLSNLVVKIKIITYLKKNLYTCKL